MSEEGVGKSNLLSTASNMLLSRKYPVSLIQFVTNRCNARCSFCFIDFEAQDSEGTLFYPTDNTEMTLEEFDKLTRSFGPHLNNINLTGGEPFLRKDLSEIISLYFKNAGVRTVFITTNGFFTKRIKECAEAVSKKYPDRQTIFSFSIDGLREQHDEIRKVNGLFDRVLESYHSLRSMAPSVMANVNITVSESNYETVNELYEQLVQEHGVRSVLASPVREEGVFKMPAEMRQKVFRTAIDLRQRIFKDMKAGVLEGFDRSTLAGRMLNAKNRIHSDLMEEILEDNYISPCHAGSLFGIIGSDGKVFPCEILDKPLGNVRDYDCNFMELWADKTASESRKWILESKCHCQYECAWTFNILGNWRYQAKLLGYTIGQ